MKPKGMQLHLKFYIKVQQEMLTLYIQENKKPLVLPWSETAYFITGDHITFYIIPEDKYCLSERFIALTEKMFQTEKHYVSEIYPGEFNPVEITGNQFATFLPNGDKRVMLELKSGKDKIYVTENAFSLFPKQKILCTKKVNLSPVFVVSTLKTLLGGVWPLNPSKNNEN